MQSDPILQLLVVLYAFAVSWITERFGSFQNLSPSVKQLVIALAGFAVPLVTTVVTALLGAWPDTVGTPDALTQALFILGAPFVVWLFTQLAHYADLALARLSGKRQ
jgi:hypothetical protein